MSDGKINVLFVGTDNSIRSIIALALLNRFARDRFHVFSAGLRPAQAIHPRTIEMLNMQGLSLEYRRPRPLSEFLDDNAPTMDLVINLSDEPLLLLPGNPLSARWRITDPLLEESDAGQDAAFRRTFRELENRVRLFSLLRHPTRQQRLGMGSALRGASMHGEASAIG